MFSWIDREKVIWIHSFYVSSPETLSLVEVQCHQLEMCYKMMPCNSYVLL